MNFSDKYKESDFPDMEIEIEDDVDIPALNVLADTVTERRVKDFLLMDKLLFEAGFADKDERYRIIEIIY